MIPKAEKDPLVGQKGANHQGDEAAGADEPVLEEVDQAVPHLFRPVGRLDARLGHVLLPVGHRVEKGVVVKPVQREDGGVRQRPEALQQVHLVQVWLGPEAVHLGAAGQEEHDDRVPVGVGAVPLVQPHLPPPRLHAATVEPDKHRPLAAAPVGVLDDGRPVPVDADVPGAPDLSAGLHQLGPEVEGVPLGLALPVLAQVGDACRPEMGTFGYF